MVAAIYICNRVSQSAAKGKGTRLRRRRLAAANGRGRQVLPFTEGRICPCAHLRVVHGFYSSLARLVPRAFFFSFVCVCAFSFSRQWGIYLSSSNRQGLEKKTKKKKQQENPDQETHALHHTLIQEQTRLNGRTTGMGKQPRPKETASTTTTTTTTGAAAAAATGFPQGPVDDCGYANQTAGRPGLCIEDAEHLGRFTTAGCH